MLFPGTYFTTEFVYGPNAADAPAQRNTLYWEPFAGPDVDDTNATDIADEVFNLFAPLYAAVLCETWSFFAVNLRYRVGSDVDVEGFSTETAVAGTITSVQPLPESDAVVIRRRTSQAGRNMRGRIFIGGIPESLQDSGRLTSGGITAYKAIGNKMDQSMILSTSGLESTPKTPSFKTTSLVTVTHAQLLLDICSRRDRRAPRQPLVSGILGV